MVLSTVNEISPILLINLKSSSYTFVPLKELVLYLLQLLICHTIHARQNFQVEASLLTGKGLQLAIQICSWEM